MIMFNDKRNLRHRILKGVSAQVWGISIGYDAECASTIA